MKRGAGRRTLGTVKKRATKGAGRKAAAPKDARTWGDPSRLRSLDQINADLASLRGLDEYERARLEQDARLDADLAVADAAWLAEREAERRDDPASLTRERAEALASALTRIASASEVTAAEASLVHDLWRRYRNTGPAYAIDGWLDVVRILDALVLGRHDGEDPKLKKPTGAELDRLATRLASAWLTHCGGHARAPARAPIEAWKAAAVAWHSRAVAEDARPRTSDGRKRAGVAKRTSKEEAWAGALGRLCAALDIDLPKPESFMRTLRDRDEARNRLKYE